MDRNDAITRLRAHESELRQLGVVHLFLFGSTARDTARPCSDVDLFFDDRTRRFGVFGLMEVKEAAGRILGCKADVITRDSLHSVLLDGIEAASVAVF